LCGDLISNCANCTNYTSCSACEDGYDLLNNECKEPDSSNTHLIIIFGSAIGGVLVVTLIGKH
jgi:hypothetical protein